MKQIIVALIVMSVVTGCARTTRHYVNATSIEGTRAVKSDNHYFVGGIAQEKDESAYQVCGHPSRVAATETRQSPMNFALGLVTFGIYTPQEHTVYCK